MWNLQQKHQLEGPELVHHAQHLEEPNFQMKIHNVILPDVENEFGE